MVKRMIPPLLLLVLLMTGCWDMMDIEDRSYVSGVGFDAPDPAEVERQRREVEKPEMFTPKYMISYVSPLPSVQAGEGEGAPFVTRSITSVTPDEAERQMANRVDEDLFFGHAKLALFGEEILKDSHKVKEIFDYFHRNQEYNWNVLIGVVEGRAEEAFDVQPKDQAELIPYITGIMENRPVSSRVADVTLSQALADAGEAGTLTLPRVLVTHDEVKVEGAAVIKNFHLLGYLNGLQGRSLMFLKGTIQGGSVVVEFEGGHIPYQMVNAGVERNLEVTQEGLQLTYAIETEGQLNEGIYGGDFVTDENIRAIEVQVEKEIVENCMEIIEKLQNDFRTDLIHADDYIQKYHPRVWDELGDDWEKHFSEMDIQVTADVKIRRAGVVN